MQYKLGILVAFGIFLLLPFHKVVAQMMPTFTNPSSLPTFAGTSWCDPLLGFCQDPYGALNQSIQQQQSQIQAQQQAWQRMQDKESTLKSQYGYAAYSSCTGNMLNIDGGNIAEVTMYLNADEPCMASYKAKQDAKTQCTAGYTFFNGSCVSGNQECVNRWGPNSVWTGTNCDCASGYQWGGSGNNQCVATTETTCKLIANTIWSGTGCGCALGYQWGGSMYNQCVATTPTCTANSTYNGSQCICNAGYSSLSGYCISNQAALAALNPPFKINDQTCQSSFGAHSIWSGEKNAQGGLVCGCGTSFGWNSSRTACVAPVTTTTSNPHSSGLAANQIAAILSLLQSFGADQSVINNVRVSLGQ